MQQTREGVKVRNVVGQVIVIYTTGAKQTRTLPIRKAMWTWRRDKPATARVRHAVRRGL